MLPEKEKTDREALTLLQEVRDKADELLKLLQEVREKADRELSLLQGVKEEDAGEFEALMQRLQPLLTGYRETGWTYTIRQVVTCHICGRGVAPYIRYAVLRPVAGGAPLRLCSRCMTALRAAAWARGTWPRASAPDAPPSSPNAEESPCA